MRVKKTIMKFRNIYHLIYENARSPGENNRHLILAPVIRNFNFLLKKPPSVSNVYKSIQLLFLKMQLLK